VIQRASPHKISAKLPTAIHGLMSSKNVFIFSYIATLHGNCDIIFGMKGLGA
jgi:hypothetical protein